jgi:ketosteroid isomerase-like protein
MTTASTQTTVTDAWVDAFTAGDVDALIACYAPHERAPVALPGAGTGRGP